MIEILIALSILFIFIGVIAHVMYAVHMHDLRISTKRASLQIAYNEMARAGQQGMQQGQSGTVTREEITYEWTWIHDWTNENGLERWELVIRWFIPPENEHVLHIPIKRWNGE